MNKNLYAILLERFWMKKVFFKKDVIEPTAHIKNIEKISFLVIKKT